MESLDQLERNIDLLLARKSELEAQFARLQESYDQQRRELVQTHGELVELQKRYHNLQVAYSLTGNPGEKLQAKQQLTNIIAQIDRAIEVLKQ